MKNFLNFLKVIIWPIIFLIGQFLILLIFCLINGTNNLSSNELEQFINKNSILITIITFLIFGFLFIKNYKKYSVNYNEKLKFKSILFIIILGSLIVISFNLIISMVNLLFNFTSYDISKTNILSYVICTGIIGPILEELLFRGIVLNKLKENYKTMTSILITSFLFAFFHQSFIQILYAFVLSFMLIYVYQKYKNILAPILLHITSNIFNLIISYIISKNINIVNLVLLIISLASLYLINVNVIQKDLKN